MLQDFSMSRGGASGLRQGNIVAGGTRCAFHGGNQALSGMCRKAWNGRRRDMERIDTGKLHQFRYVVNPYLRHLEAQGALCPKCAAKLSIEPAS